MEGVLTDNNYDVTTDPIEHTGSELPNYNIYDEINGGIINIIDKENQRLAQKEGEIDKLYETHERKKHYQISTTKRNNAYWRMFMLILCLAIIVVLLYMFRNTFPFIPSTIMDLILIACVAGGGIYLLLMYEDILKRDLTNFDKLDPHSPAMLRDKEIKDAEELQEKGKLSAALNANPNNCQGEDCCVSGTYFDKADKKCKLTVEGFGPYQATDGFSLYT